MAIRVLDNTPDLTSSAAWGFATASPWWTFAITSVLFFPLAAVVMEFVLNWSMVAGITAAFGVVWFGIIILTTIFLNLIKYVLSYR